MAELQREDSRTGERRGRARPDGVGAADALASAAPAVGVEGGEGERRRGRKWQVRGVAGEGQGEAGGERDRGGVGERLLAEDDDDGAGERSDEEEEAR